MSAARGRARTAQEKIDRSLPVSVRCFPTCDGWHIVNPNIEPELQRCDACWAGIADPLTDAEAATLAPAREQLHLARTALAKVREGAVGLRRVAIVADDGLISPCCRQLVLLRTLAITSLAVDIEHDRDGNPIIRTVVMSRPSRQGPPDLVEPGTAVCSRCGRLLQLPAGFEAVL
jgi:hypothetical protein